MQGRDCVHPKEQESKYGEQRERLSGGHVLVVLETHPVAHGPHRPATLATEGCGLSVVQQPWPEKQQISSDHSQGEAAEGTPFLRGTVCFLLPSGPYFGTPGYWIPHPVTTLYSLVSFHKGEAFPSGLSPLWALPSIHTDTGLSQKWGPEERRE